MDLGQLTGQARIVNELRDAIYQRRHGRDDHVLEQVLGGRDICHYYRESAE